MESLSWIKDLLPQIFAAVGALVSLWLTLTIWLGKRLFRAHLKRIQKIELALVKLDESMKIDSESQRQTLMAIQGMRAETRMSNERMEHLKAGLLSLEGSIKAQQLTINSYIERLGLIDGKLEAVFRFVDARKRATDS